MYTRLTCHLSIPFTSPQLAFPNEPYPPPPPPAPPPVTFPSSRNDSPRPRRVRQQTRRRPNPPPQIHRPRHHPLQYPPHIRLPTRRRLPPKRHSKAPPIMDHPARQASFERSESQPARHRLHMLHQRSRHGCAIAKRSSGGAHAGPALG